MAALRNLGGRPRVHRSNAAKQHAYRKRKAAVVRRAEKAAYRPAWFLRIPDAKREEWAAVGLDYHEMAKYLRRHRQLLKAFASWESHSKSPDHVLGPNCPQACYYRSV